MSKNECGYEFTFGEEWMRFFWIISFVWIFTNPIVWIVLIVLPAEESAALLDHYAGMSSSLLEDLYDYLHPISDADFTLQQNS